MNIKSDYTFDLIKKGLDATAMNGKVIANNISNINTKEYKRKYMNFDEVIKGEVKGLNLKTTKDKHFDIGNGTGNTVVKEDNSTSMKADGNNVDLDIEKVNQAANSLMYNALITQANNKMNMMKSVISGGR